jgi:hypothetical protein
VAACFVTGIVPTEHIKELESTLGSIEGLDQSKLTVITKAERSYEHDSSFLNFIHAGPAQIDSDVVGSLAGGGGGPSIGTDGTGVPGIGASSSSLGMFGSHSIVQHVGTLPIPADEADNYNDALEDGRTIVAYECDPADTPRLEAAFRSAGVRKVKTFKG